MTTERCSRCGVPFESLDLRSVCQHCGASRDEMRHPHGPRAEESYIRKYFSTLWEVLFHPIQFFKNIEVNKPTGFSIPLAFALITHWAGTALAFLFRGLFADNESTQILWFKRFFSMTRDPEFFYSFQDRLAHWMWGVGPVLLDPFITLFWVLTTSFLIFVGARILVSSPSGTLTTKETYSVPITFESSLQIVCFSMSTAIFTALPWVGGLIDSIWFSLLLIIGVREVYRQSTGKSVVIALFPNLFFLGILLFGILLFTVGALKFIAAF